MKATAVIFAVLIALVAASSSSSSSSSKSSSSDSSASSASVESLPVLLFELDTDNDDGGSVITYDLISGQIVGETTAAFDGVDGADWIGLLSGFAIWFDASGLNYLGLFDPATGGIGTVDVFANQGALLFGDITAACDGRVWLTTAAENDPTDLYPIFAYTNQGWLSILNTTEFVIRSITFDEKANTLWAISGTDLYAVSPEDGSQSLIGPHNANLFPGVNSGLSIDDNGNLWLVRNFGADSEIYSINKETGAASLKATVADFAAAAIAVPHGCPVPENEEPNTHSNDGKGKGKGKQPTAIQKFLGVDE